MLARFEQLEAKLKMHDELKRTLMGELKLFSEGRIKELLLELNNPDVFVYFYWAQSLEILNHAYSVFFERLLGLQTYRLGIYLNYLYNKNFSLF